MGSPMVQNLLDAQIPVLGFDADPSRGEPFGQTEHFTRAASAEAVATSCDTVVSMLPNDRILKDVASEESAFFRAMRPGAVHISCSTVSPETSRELAKSHKERGVLFAAAPVFARPDGIQKQQAFWMVSGDEAATERARGILATTSPQIYVLGEDAGLANVLKLSGNFLIAAAIEALAEALALAEANGLDRRQAAGMLTSTIFDCIIYKGYGQRVSERDHRPGGFALELGLKDVKLVLDAAEKAKVPMPFGSVLRDRFLASSAKGRAELDWSAVGLISSEDAGINVDDAIRMSSESESESESGGR